MRLQSLTPPKGSNSTRLTISDDATGPEIALRQLVLVRRLINESLDVIDVSTWTGDPMNASFIEGQLRLLYDNLSEARLTLKGEGEESKKLWNEDSVDKNVCFSLSSFCIPSNSPTFYFFIFIFLTHEHFVEIIVI